MSKSGKVFTKRDTTELGMKQEKKRLHFDEENIRSSYKKKTEVIAPNIANISYTKLGGPIDPEILHQKLEKLRAKQNVFENVAKNKSSVDVTSNLEDLDEVTKKLKQYAIGIDSDESTLNVTPQETFEEKRKRFHKNEFKRTQERLAALEKNTEMLTTAHIP